MISGDVLGSGALKNVHIKLTGNLQKRYERLTSGVKINYAVDDPSGLAIGKTMTAVEGGIATAIQNIQDTMSLVNVAHGGLQEANDILNRVNALVIKAANEAPISSSDRLQIQREIDALLRTLNYTAEVTNYNNIYMLNGAGVSIEDIYELAEPSNKAVSIYSRHASITPDSRYMLFISNRLDAEGTNMKGAEVWEGNNVWALDLSNEKVYQVTNFEDLAQGAVDPVMEQKGRFVVFAQGSYGNDSFTGSGLKKIANFTDVLAGAEPVIEDYLTLEDIGETSGLGKGIRYCNFSPDGKKVTFTVFDFGVANGKSIFTLEDVDIDGMKVDIDLLDAKINVYVADLDSEGNIKKDTVKKVEGVEGTLKGVFTADSKNILFNKLKDADTDPFYRIYIANVDGTGAREFLNRASLPPTGEEPNQSTSFSNPVVSPDGSYVVFHGVAMGPGELFICDNFGNQIRYFLPESKRTPDVDENKPLFSPDGAIYYQFEITQPNEGEAERGGLMGCILRNSRTAQIGAFNGPGVQTLEIPFVNIRANALGLSLINVTTTEDAQLSIDIVKNAMNKVINYMAQYGVIEKKLSNVLDDFAVQNMSISYSRSLIMDADMAEELTSKVITELQLNFNADMLSFTNLSMALKYDRFLNSAFSTAQVQEEGGGEI